MLTYSVVGGIVAHAASLPVSNSYRSREDERNQSLYKLRDAALAELNPDRINVDQRNRLLGFIHALELVMENASVGTERVAKAHVLDVMENTRKYWNQIRYPGKFPNPANASPTSEKPTPEVNVKA